MRCVLPLIVAVALASCATGQEDAAQPPTGATWGYVGKVEGAVITLDDGQTLELAEGAQVIKLDGTVGAPTDILKGLKAVAQRDGAGKVTRLELLPAPPAPEYYLSAMTVRGATVVPAEIDGRVYPRSLALLQGSVAARSDVVRLEGEVAYQPQGGGPNAARFTILNAAGETMFEADVAGGQTAPFRLTFSPGYSPAYNLRATPVGDGTLKADWCLWLDPRFVGRSSITPGPVISPKTAAALIQDLAKALGETKPGPIGIPQFGRVRVSDAQVCVYLQEDLVVAGVGVLPIAGKVPQAVALATAPDKNAVAALGELGAKTVLTGTVSDRGGLTVINAALMDVESGKIIATARTQQ
jgi:hypothetical protein